MADERPTELAERMFQLAGIKTARGGPQGLSPNEMASALYDLSRGLEAMAVGMRATYMAVDQVNKKLDRLLPPRTVVAMKPIEDRDR